MVSISTEFEWDEEKNQRNLKKHSVSFYLAQYAFADQHRVIAEDIGHSSQERRYYCFGRVSEGILTGRFTYRERRIRIIGAEGGSSMRKKIKYTNEPLGKLRIIPDRLPRPEELAFKEENTKVTMMLSKNSVEYFKSVARKHHTQYQKMIRNLLDSYVRHYR